MGSTPLEKKLDLAEKILEKNPHADISNLIQLSKEDQERSFVKEYVFSIIFAPLGIYYFFRYISSRYIKQAFLCLLLTCIMTLVYIIIGDNLFAPLTRTNTNIIGGLKNLGI